MRWQSGQACIVELIAEGQLERRDADLDDARARLARSEAHLAQLQATDITDAVLRARLAFSAMATSAVALLVAQGLRQTDEGGLAAVQRAVNAQFSGGPVPGVFATLTAISEPPTAFADARSLEERVRDAAIAADWAVAYAVRLLGTGLLHEFTDDEAIAS
jgi:hypothetical protein